MKEAMVIGLLFLFGACGDQDSKVNSEQSVAGGFLGLIEDNERTGSNACLQVKDSLLVWQFMDSLCVHVRSEKPELLGLYSSRLRGEYNGPEEDGSDMVTLVREFICENEREREFAYDKRSFHSIGGSGSCVEFKVNRNYPDSEYGVEISVAKEDGQILIVNIQMIG